jgi:hypothetical protein
LAYLVSTTTFAQLDHDGALAIDSLGSSWAVSGTVSLSGFSRILAAFRALMILFMSPQLILGKGGMSVMRYEFNPLNTAMIGALQACLLSARPR